MDPIVLYIVAIVLGFLAGILAATVNTSPVTSTLNRMVNELRADGLDYTPRENAHWLAQEFYEGLSEEEWEEALPHVMETDDKEPGRKDVDKIV